MDARLWPGVASTPDVPVTGSLRPQWHTPAHKPRLCRHFGLSFKGISQGEETLE